MRCGTALLWIVGAWLGALAAADAGEGEARKCSGREGPSYVSGPCPPGTREVWTRRIESAPAAAPGRSQRRPAAEAPRKPRRAASAGRGGRGGATQKETSCEAAKRRRAEVRDRDWYTITYERLSALDERVARACR